MKEIENFNLKDEVQVIRTGCFGLCAEGPIVIVYPEGAFYSKVADSDVKEIVEEHLLKGRIVKGFCIKSHLKKPDKVLK